MGKFRLQYGRPVASGISTSHARTCRLSRDASLSIGELRLASVLPNTASRLFATARERLDDLLPVETPVLDEDLAGMPAANDHARQIDARNIALQRVGIESRLPRFGVKPNAKALDEFEVRVISRQCEHLLGRNSLLAGTI